MDSSKNKSIFLPSDFDEYSFPIKSELIDVVACLKRGDAQPTFEEPEPLPAVYDLSVLDVWNMAQDSRIPNVRPDNSNDYFSKMGGQPFGFRGNGKASVNINLYATDEQIKNEFSQWLVGRRKVVVCQPPKKLFTHSDFNYWIQYGVIPYLDLVLIAKIEGKKITQNKLAKLIFPDEYDVDITGRLRDTTKPEAERLIKNEIHRSLSTQLSYEINGMKNA